MRNQLTSIPFPDPIQAPKGNRITLPGIGSVRFHQQELPVDKIKCGRLVKRATGWYLCLFIDAEPRAIIAFGEIGIDPGFSHLLTTSDCQLHRYPQHWMLPEEVRRALQDGSHMGLICDQLITHSEDSIANHRPVLIRGPGLLVQSLRSV